MFRLSLAWESLQKRDNSALNSFQGRLLCRVETAHHLEVRGVEIIKELRDLPLSELDCSSNLEIPSKDYRLRYWSNR